MSEETKLYQEIGILQGQMSAIQVTQQATSTNIAGLENRLKIEIDKFTRSMDSRIVVVEKEQSGHNLKIMKIKWSLSVITFLATVLANFAQQFFFHYIK